MTFLVIALFLATPSDHPRNDGFRETVRETAREDVQLAEAEFNLGHYVQAASLYEQAYKLVPDPVLLYNIGQSFRLGGESGKAILAYRSYLRTSSEMVSNRQHVEELIVELEASLATSPDTRLNLEPVLPQPPSSLASQELQAKPIVASPWSRWAFWTGAAVTTALGVTAIIEGLSANSSFNSLQRICGKTKSCTDAQLSGAKSKVLITNVLWGLTAVSATATGVFFYLNLSNNREANISLSLRY
jgi:hypothetical protein